MRERIERLRKTGVSDPHGDYQIGCLMIAEPTFFGPHEWVKAPSDFHPSIQQGTTYDLGQGEGKRLWEECLSRARSRRAVELMEEARRYGTPMTVLPRLGQGIFRISVTDAYGRACAVTTEHSLPALVCRQPGVETLVNPHHRLVPVVHPGASQLGILHVESEWLDQMKTTPGDRCQPHGVTGVRWDLRAEEDDVEHVSGCRRVEALCPRRHVTRRSRLRSLQSPWSRRGSLPVA